MSLLSELFSGNTRLLAAATLDSGHIMLGAVGPHVAKIQEALNRLDSAGLKVDSQYGPRTAAAVVTFKTKRNIRNAAGQIDNIVGIKTMAALDGSLPRKLNDGPSPGPAGDVRIDPFLGPVLLTAVTTDPDKSDLDDRDPPRFPLTTFQKLALIEVQFEAESVLELRMSGELFLMAQKLGLLMFDKFKNNRTRAFRMEFFRNDPLGSAVASGTDLTNVHDAIRLELDKLLKAQFATGRVNINSLQATVGGQMQGNRRTITNPNGVKTEPVVDIKGSLPLLAVIGGSFGGGSVTVTAFKADQLSYEATIHYELIDHFGVDNSDLIFDGFHGTPGQKAFWLLQHKHAPGHKPYVTTVIFDFQVSGRWALTGS